MKITVTTAVVILLTIAGFVGMLLYTNADNKQLLERAGLFHFRPWGNNNNNMDSTTTSFFTNEEIIAMRQRLSPRELIHDDDDDADQKLFPHQFLHLHHMKTGGTCK
jgi:hypothetical protein